MFLITQLSEFPKTFAAVLTLGQTRPWSGVSLQPLLPNGQSFLSFEALLKCILPPETFSPDSPPISKNVTLLFRLVFFFFTDVFLTFSLLFA